MSGSWTNPNAPNVTDFTSFIYNNMGVPVSALPLNSPWPQYAFNQAMALTPFYPQVASIEYVLAVYNCGGHILIRITPDQAASVTGSITGGVMTVTAVASGTITPGAAITNLTAATAPLTVVYFGTGIGGTGTYTVSNDDISIASTAIALSVNYFTTLRGNGPGGFSLNGLLPGVVQSSGDVSTNQSLLVPDFFKMLTLSDLNFIKTPYGQWFLEYCQDAGPSVWGLT